jgi:hypothetical protein
VVDEEIGTWGSAAMAGRIAGLTPAWMRVLADRGIVRARRTALGRLFDLRDVERLRRDREGTRGEGPG